MFANFHGLGFLHFGLKWPRTRTLLKIIVSILLLSVVTIVIVKVIRIIRDLLPYSYNTYKGYPLSIYDHPYNINTNGTCAGNSKLNMIIVIHSKVTHFRKRALIRQTWANRHLLSYYNMRLVFILGMHAHEDIQLLIRQESMKYNDIVQGTFQDSYTNLTHKAVLWIRWVKEYCPNSIYILKLDDDVLVNLFSLYHTFIPKYENESKKMWCQTLIAGTERIHRHRGNKHRIADNEMKGLIFFPFTLCRGYFVIMTQDNIRPLYEAAKKTPFFWIDDYYVFGELAHTIQAQHMSLSGYLTEGKAAFKCFNSKEKRCSLFGAIVYYEDVTEKLWELVVNNIDSFSE